MNKQAAREWLGLPRDKRLVLFGAVGGRGDPRKGLHLLRTAFRHLVSRGLADGVEAVVFGASEQGEELGLDVPTHYMGRLGPGLGLHDDASLALLYGSADVMVVPSRQEAFGQTGSEATSCGTPVVAFDGTGLSAIVEHQRTGYLAVPYEPGDLANGIAWVIADETRWHRLSSAAREKAEREFASETVAREYERLYRSVSAALRGGRP